MFYFTSIRNSYDVCTSRMCLTCDMKYKSLCLEKIN